MSLRTIAATAIVACLTLALAGCGKETDSGMKNTITSQEANQRLDAYIQQAKSALSISLELTGRDTDQPCDDPTDNGPKGRLIAGRSYKLTGTNKNSTASYFAKLKTWSTENNFHILTEKHNPEYLWIEKRDDGFRLALQSNDLGEIYLDGSSPCVWRNGTPEPQQE
ncbi:hypothetical protein [Amycolatopsis orientalis]|uniref:hypothetical protein n=1 Tax=Amycolatopsis orientalis TaxID=31958 RepID=UPI001F15EEBF|nr:hypothetical protein [Amycolatopsis orientalis]